MTLPWRGLLCGTTTKKRASPRPWRSRIASRSFAPPIVSLARTSTFPIPTPPSAPPPPPGLPGRDGSRFPGRHGSALDLLAGGAEDAVHRARHAVLVRAPDDGRPVVEVEDGRRGAPLPLERERAPRVGLRAGAPAPGRDHVVDEDERREPEHEARQRDEQVPARELLRIVRHAPGHALDADQVH